MLEKSQRLQDAPVPETELRKKLRKKIAAMNPNKKPKKEFVPAVAASRKKLGKCQKEEQCTTQEESCAANLFYADQFVFEIESREDSVAYAWESLAL